MHMVKKCKEIFISNSVIFLLY